MSQPKKFIKKPSKLYRSLVTTLLIANGIFQLIVPALAEGTKAGESISNTATATYEDPLDPGTKINTTSNTVVVTVAEVAGITVTASGVTDSTPATPVSAEYLSPGIDATIKYPGIKCDGSNTNGAIVVKLGNLPNATAPGIPASS